MVTAMLPVAWHTEQGMIGHALCRYCKKNRHFRLVTDMQSHAEDVDFPTFVYNIYDNL